MKDDNVSKTDLNLLKSLQALLLERNVSRAASRMHISQSAMSHKLAKLREAFGDPLFVRTTSGFEPTPRALSLAPQLSTILDEVETLLTPENLDPAKISTRFRLQTHSFVVSGYLGPFFNTVHRLAPNIIFESHPITDLSYQQLILGNIDLVVSGGYEAPAHLLQRRIFEEDWVCLIDKNHPARENWCIETFSQYQHIKHMLMSDKVDPVTQELEKRDMHPRKVGFYAADLLTHSVVLRDSELIATLPRSLAENGARQFGHIIRECPFDLPEIVVKAIWHERSQKDQIHRWVRDQLALSF